MNLEKQKILKFRKLFSSLRNFSIISLKTNKLRIGGALVIVQFFLNTYIIPQ